RPLGRPDGGHRHPPPGAPRRRAPDRRPHSGRCAVRARLTLAMLTGTAALGAGLGLTAVAAWLITTAAGQPFIAELLVAVVAVRAFGISKGVLRYAERLLSHDLAFRALGVLRLRVYD